MNIELTRDEVESLELFMDCELLDSIRRDIEIDNLEYVYNILTVYKKLQKAIEEDESNANQ